MTQATKVSVLNQPGAEVVGTQRKAERTALEYVTWLDNGTNTGAIRYYADKQGQPQHENVDVVTKAGVDCMRRVR